MDPLDAMEVTGGAGENILFDGAPPMTDPDIPTDG